MQQVAEASMDMDSITVPLHGEFMVDGVAGSKKYVFLPKGDIESRAMVNQLLQFWGLKKPNLVLQTNDNVTPSNTLVDEEMLKQCPDFQQMESVTKDTSATHSVTMGHHLESRLQQALGSMMVAADMTDSWILSKGFAFSNHEMFEEAMSRTKATPKVLVVDDPTRYFDKKGGKHWNPHQTKARKVFEALLAGATPWKNKAKELVRVDMTKEELYRIDDDGKRYCNWSWVGGTHYVFTVDPELFNDVCLGPSGNIFIGGYFKATRKSIQQSIIEGRPAILINNTGGESQEYAQFLDALVAKGNLPNDELQQQAQELLDASLLGQKNRKLHGYARHMNMADILQLIDKHCEIPWLFRDRIIVVNPLTETPRQILNRLSQCFASVYVNIHEVAAGPVDKEAVLSAWRVHRRLECNAALHRSRANILACCSIAITFLASSVAIVNTYFKSLREHELEELRFSRWMDSLNVPVSVWFPAMGYLVLMLPAVGTMIAGFIAFGGWLGKYAALHMAAQRVVTEIYRFRMRVGPYSVTATDADEENTSVLMHHSRSRFAREVQSFIRQVMQDDLKADALELSDAEAVELKAHVNRTVYGSRCNDTRAEKPSDYQNESASYLLLESHGVNYDTGDDFISGMSNEAYFEGRVRGLLQMYERKAPWLNCLFKALQFAALFCSSLATVLAAVKLDTWLPIAVSCTVVFNSVISHYNLKQWLTGMTASVGELQALEMEWSALGAIDRRLLSTRETLVSVCEEATLRVVAAETGGVTLQSRADDSSKKIKSKSNFKDLATSEQARST